MPPTYPRSLRAGVLAVMVHQGLPLFLCPPKHSFVQGLSWDHHILSPLATLSFHAGSCTPASHLLKSRSMIHIARRALPVQFMFGQTTGPGRGGWFGMLSNEHSSILQAVSNHSKHTHQMRLRMLGHAVFTDNPVAPVIKRQCMVSSFLTGF